MIFKETMEVGNGSLFLDPAFAVRMGSWTKLASRAHVTTPKLQDAEESGRATEHRTSLRVVFVLYVFGWSASSCMLLWPG